MSQNTKLIGEPGPFDRTMLMMEVEKKEFEILYLTEQLKTMTSALAEISKINMHNAVIFSEAMSISDEDWAGVVDHSLLLGHDLKGDDFIFLRPLFADLLKIKLASACLKYQKSP